MDEKRGWQKLNFSDQITLGLEERLEGDIRDSSAMFFGFYPEDEVTSCVMATESENCIATVQAMVKEALPFEISDPPIECGAMTIIEQEMFPILESEI